MPWTCPACSSQIQRKLGEDDPRPDVIYRCHICRLELVFDTAKQKMVLVPLGPPSQPSDDPQAA